MILTIEQKLRAMSLFEYISVFGSVTDQDAYSETFKKRIPFKLWPRQVELCRFLEETQIALAPKSRQKGLSEVGAERAIKTLMENEGVEGVAISISEDVAKYFLDRRIKPKYDYISKLYPYFPKITEHTKDRIVWENGSSFNSIPSSNTAAASRTLDFLIIDEAGGIDENRGKLSEDSSLFKKILTNSMPALNQNPKAWAMIIGTSVPGSYYNKMVREAYESKNKTNHKYFFIGWWHQPGRDEEWYKKEKEIQKTDMPLQHPTDMEDFFFIKDGRVFPHFDDREGGRHIYEFDIGTEFRRKLEDRVVRYKPSFTLDYKTSYDHGTKHPAVNIYALHDKYRDILYVFDETYFEEGHSKSVEEINEAIVAKINKYPRKPDVEIADGAIFNEVGIKSVGSTFKSLGRRFKKARKHDESESRELLSARFRHNKIFIHPRCYNLIRQLRNYVWDSRTNGERPIQVDDDAIDALRYLCNDCITLEKVQKEKEEDPDVNYKMNKYKDIRKNNEYEGGISWMGM